MRKYLLYLLTSVLALPLWAQGGDCPGWKNPTSFNTGSPMYTWTARVGQRISSGASTGYTIFSTCAASNCPDITGHANITSSTYNTGADGGISCCNDGNIWDANDSRFQIITNANAGLDQFTINNGTGMQRIPQGYSSCIRLGDPRSNGTASNSNTWSSGSNLTAEALFYTMYVTPLNALLIINYAVVGRCYSHTPAEAGEFLIRVVKQNDDGTWPNAPINDSMWFRISAPPIPSSGIPDAPWQMGRPGSSCGATTCAYVYKPWTKVAVSLSQYLYQNVRVELYNSDCIYAVDPIYAYVCGDYKPMRINSSGCADANSSAIDTLSAPQGLTQYRWYAATMGPEEDILNAEYMSTVHFRVLTDTSSSNFYVPTINDFILTEGPNAGDTVARQTFMCTMVSALDPNKPITSRIYANVDNDKPFASFLYTADCNRTAYFSNQSVAYGSNTLDMDSTCWYIYSDSIGTTVVDTLWGDEVSYQFPAEGYYKVSVRVKVVGKDCGTIWSDVCRIKEEHPVPIALSESVVCQGEKVTAYCTEHCDLDKVWTIGDSLTYTSDELHSYDSVTFTVPAGITTITLTTSNNGLCEATTTTTVKGIGNSTITSDVDASLICRGDSVVLSAFGVDEPRWLSSPYDSLLGDGYGQNTVVVTPQVTTTYTAQPTGDTRCVQNASSITIMVLPYPIPTIWTSKNFVDITDPILTIEDRSPYSNSSEWHFSDGLTEHGGRVEHRFGGVGDSVYITLNTCNEQRCCSDTTISLPVLINALWIPNVFTPGELNNNVFRMTSTIPVVEYEIWIYNRHGILMYHGEDFEQGWDGRDQNGNPCPQGAYAYFYRYTLNVDADRPRTGTGTVTLIR